MQKRPCDLGYSTRDPSKFVKKNTHDRARLLSLSPTKPPLPTPLASPASSGAAQHAPELPTVRPSLPSGHILRSRPLPSARNQTLVARVSGKASSAHLRQPQMQMKHAMGVPHPPRSPPSSASSRRCEGPHGPAAPQGFILSPSYPLPFPSLPHEHTHWVTGCTTTGQGAGSGFPVDSPAGASFEDGHDI
ncbi:hypothetical protein VPH35_094599 [Triticum aestivum]